MNETNAMWRKVRTEERGKAARRSRARMNALERAADAGKVRIVRPLGPHGVRLASTSRPECRIDYWPARGTALVVGTSRARTNVSVRQVLKMLEQVDR